MGIDAAPTLVFLESRPRRLVVKVGAMDPRDFRKLASKVVSIRQ